MAGGLWVLIVVVYDPAYLSTPQDSLGFINGATEGSWVQVGLLTPNASGALSNFAQILSYVQCLETTALYLKSCEDDDDEEK